jgi:hypothetical protein
MLVFMLFGIILFLNNFKLNFVFSHNPKYFEKPFEFLPERWKNKNLDDPF